jgi:hypothetical protein
MRRACFFSYAGYSCSVFSCKGGLTETEWLLSGWTTPLGRSDLRFRSYSSCHRPSVLCAWLSSSSRPSRPVETRVGRRIYARHGRAAAGGCQHSAGRQISGVPDAATPAFAWGRETWTRHGVAWATAFGRTATARWPISGATTDNSSAYIRSTHTLSLSSTLDAPNFNAPYYYCVHVASPLPMGNQIHSTSLLQTILPS